MSKDKDFKTRLEIAKKKIQTDSSSDSDKKGVFLGNAFKLGTELVSAVAVETAGADDPGAGFEISCCVHAGSSLSTSVAGWSVQHVVFTLNRDVGVSEAWRFIPRL